MFQYKAFRKEVGISQIDLAKLLGCGQPNISAMERTNRNLEAEQEKILRSKYGDDIINRYSSFEPEHIDDADYVPLLPVEAMAGTLQGLSQGIELAGCQKIKSPVKGADWAIVISGDS
ncbi:MAG: helix-turn-helix transcriptional regulator, partial [Clostridia bacterium]|nr:helix-turn-helix transcriptional regulator [Clostridia bacterium]